MAGISNNLYPPIFHSSYMPAFVKEQGCKIVFSISKFNAISDINTDAVQVSVRSQKTNRTALNESLYPSGFMFKSLRPYQNETGEDLYYVWVSNADVNFNIRQRYQVQLRFLQKDVTNPENSYSWINKNLESFSEWSTVVLIKPIAAPSIQLNYFSQEQKEIILNLDELDVCGIVTFKNDTIEDDQQLKSYNIHIYDDQDFLLEDSGECLSQNNKILYRCKYGFETGKTYKLGIQILTNNSYSLPQEKQYIFTMNFAPYSIFEGRISVTPDDEASRIKIQLTKDIVTLSTINVLVRRSSIDTDFKIWQDVYQAYCVAGALMNFTWYDYTAENGVWYKYSAQQVNKRGYKSTAIVSDPVMIVTDHMFLAADEKQLKIKFDPQISQFAYTVSQNQSQTLGSKYPFIIRNGAVKYRTFSLSGTITHFMDIRENSMKASKADLYGDYQVLYQDYNQDHHINLFNDSVYQKKFRDKVMEFLYKNNVKLFKSTTEGNIFVKLMNISFTPNTTLNRHIYSFSCTAYEVDDFSYENCLKYNIQRKGFFSFEPVYSRQILGQIYKEPIGIWWSSSPSWAYNKRKALQGFNFSPALAGQEESKKYYYESSRWLSSNDIVEEIRRKYQSLESDTVKINTDNTYLSYLKIELTSDPYLIGINTEGRPYKLNFKVDKTNEEDSEKNQNTMIVQRNGAYYYGQDRIWKGHLMTLNGDTPVIINENGVYELADPGTRVQRLNFASNKQYGTISYIIQVYLEQKQNLLPKAYFTQTKVGQLWGMFDLGYSLYSTLNKKYSWEKYVDVQEHEPQLVARNSLQTITKIRIHADQGTVVYVKEARDSGLNKHIVGQGEMLQFDGQETQIQGIYFLGPHLVLAQRENSPKDNEFVETGLIFNKFEDISSPVKNGVYTILQQSGNGIGNDVEEEYNALGLDVSIEDIITKFNFNNLAKKNFFATRTLVQQSYSTYSVEVTGNNTVIIEPKTNAGSSAPSVVFTLFKITSADVGKKYNLQIQNPSSFSSNQYKIGIYRAGNSSFPNSNHTKTIESSDVGAYLSVFLQGSTLSQVRFEKVFVYENSSNKTGFQGRRFLQNLLNEESSNIQNLPLTQRNLLIDKIYQILLKKYIQSGNRYIYYKGSWCSFTNENDVSINEVTAIVDYYCTILKEEY